MCKFEDGFILCTCNDKEGDKNQLIADQSTYVWELRIIKEKQFAVGRTKIPSSNIGEGLDAEWVLLNLEDRNCFDFDYQPQEEDNLVLYPKLKEPNNYRYSFLSFIYRDNQWIEDFYDEISVITKLKKKGFLKAIDVASS